jgi:hypothetical protein
MSSDAPAAVVTNGLRAAPPPNMMSQVFTGRNIKVDEKTMTDTNGYQYEVLPSDSPEDATRRSELCKEVRAAEGGINLFYSNAKFDPVLDIGHARHPDTDDVIWVTPVGVGESSAKEGNLRLLPLQTWASTDFVHKAWEQLSDKERAEADETLLIHGHPVGRLIEKIRAVHSSAAKKQACKRTKPSEAPRAAPGAGGAARTKRAAPAGVSDVLDEITEETLALCEGRGASIADLLNKKVSAVDNMSPVPMLIGTVLPDKDGPMKFAEAAMKVVRKMAGDGEAAVKMRKLIGIMTDGSAKPYSEWFAQFSSKTPVTQQKCIAEVAGTLYAAITVAQTKVDEYASQYTEKATQFDALTARSAAAFLKLNEENRSLRDKLLETRTQMTALSAELEAAKAAAARPQAPPHKSETPAATAPQKKPEAAAVAAKPKPAAASAPPKAKAAASKAAAPAPAAAEEDAESNESALLFFLEEPTDASAGK